MVLSLFHGMGRYHFLFGYEGIGRTHFLFSPETLKARSTTDRLGRFVSYFIFSFFLLFLSVPFAASFARATPRLIGSRAPTPPTASTPSLHRRRPPCTPMPCTPRLLWPTPHASFARTSSTEHAGAGHGGAQLVGAVHDGARQGLRRCLPGPSVPARDEAKGGGSRRGRT